MRRPITIELDEETIGLLEVIGKGWALGGQGTAEEVLAHLAVSAAEGVRRPGSWERGWVVQGCGDGWETELEQDPGTPFAQRRRGG